MKQLITALLFLTLTTFAQAQDVVLTSKVEVSGAPKVHLILNEEYLITYSLIRRVSNYESYYVFLNFKNRLWELDQETYQKLTNIVDIDSKAINRDPEFLNEFSAFFEKAKAIPEYKTIYWETLTYMEQSLVEWDANLANTYEFMQKYSGFDFNHDAFVYITHPDLGNGRMQNKEKKQISFGARATFENYFTVYIWHEILHFHMAFDQYSHMANQLLTDNELRVYLNGGDMEPLEGHDEHLRIMKKKLPIWKRYMKAPTDLNHFAKKISGR